jgi:hypothetical protein
MSPKCNALSNVAENPDKKDVSVSIKMKRSDLDALLGAAEKHWPGASKFMTQSGKILALAMRGAELLELHPQAADSKKKK